ncbi:hypothetical protein [Sorangium sp. So ce854]|uniref:hypothetical protein n=1 Tax=Sorangium sp. So ce854 TaxID=3133322 RepID=UPI003F5E2E2F
MIQQRSAQLALALVGFALGCESKHASQEAKAHQSMPSGVPAQSASTPTDNSIASSASASSLTLVADRSLVCMVNNQFMGRPQIPIEVDGRTYYGCCEMCKGRLGSDPSSRVATDPVSRNAVDKATAVIGRTSDGCRRSPCDAAK